MSSSLEKLCRTEGLSYQRDSDGLCVTASHTYPEAPHSIKISETKNGRVGILVLFPECKVKKIKDAEALCGEVQKHFVSGATLSFDDAGGNFFIYDVTSKRMLTEYINKLARDCDFAKPLLTSVGEMGHCSYGGIWLANLQPSEMGQYPN